MLVSAGFDAHERDPLASMRMTSAGYGGDRRWTARLAGRRGGVALVTEGGYDLAALAECLEASFAAIAEPRSVVRDGADRRCDGARRARGQRGPMRP